MTTACNLRGESPLSSALAARESPAATWEDPLTVLLSRGNTSRKSLFPPTVPPAVPPSVNHCVDLMVLRVSPRVRDDRCD
jgi:hypothetical protein